MNNYMIRTGVLGDRENLKALYQSVAKIEGGIARTLSEITDGYIDKIMGNALDTGYLFVADYEGEIIGSIHAHALGPQVFAHVLGEITIVVHTEFQGKGIGSALITMLLNEVREHRPDILRVELMARESNVNAIKLYEKMGFVQEGRLEKRVRGMHGLEADIPMAWFRSNW
jgi:Acetyltransferases